MTTRTENANIYIDTNVLIGAFSDDNRFDSDRECWKYLISLRGKRLFVSSLSIAQMVALFQKRFTNQKIKEKILSITAKTNIVDFSEKDINASLELADGDMEDNIQYVLCRKMRCTKFVTKNVKDYGHYLNIEVVTPKKVRTIAM